MIYKIIFFILIIIFIILIIMKKNIHDNLNKTVKKIMSIHLNNIYKYVNTGDIILFRSYKIDIIHDIISPFTHIGLIIVQNNNYYILETHKKGDTKYMGFDTEGPNLYALYERLSKYKGELFILIICQYILKFLILIIINIIFLKIVLLIKIKIIYPIIYIMV